MKVSEWIMKLSIHRALAEIKLLDSRIEKATKNKFLGYKKISEDKVLGSTKNKKDFKEEVKSNYQSVTDLINRRLLLKKLVNKSNSETIVTVNGQEMTVTEAIEYKKIIDYKEVLLTNLQVQYRNVLATVKKENDNVEYQLNSQLEALNSSDSNKSKDLSGFTEIYRQQHCWEVIDGINIEDKIKELQTEIEDFKTNIDYILSESNAITQIEIED